MKPAHDSAELVLRAIEGAMPGGLNMRMLLHRTGLTPGQYRAAYNWTLDNLGEPVWIKNYVGGEWIYLLPEFEQNVHEDWQRTIKTQVTRARREYHKIHAIAQEHPTLNNRQSEEQARNRLELLRIEKERLSA
jgi:hypothetical protein